VLDLRTLTLFVDLEESKLLFATEGRDAETVGAFRKDLAAHDAQPEQIEEFLLDMSAAYQKGIDESFQRPRSDKLHIVKLINEAVDQVRRQEQKQRPELKGSRYVWIKNPDNLTSKQIAISDALQPPSLNLKTVRAYHMRLSFQDLSALEKDAARAS
jgi:transposase